MSYRGRRGQYPAARGLLAGAALAFSIAAFFAAARPPTRSNGPWCRPIRTIRRSTRSARRCAPPTKTFRQALSGYRPKLSVTANGGYDYSSTLAHTVVQSVFPNTVTYTNFAEPYKQRGFGATATQTLYNGNQTANKVRQAESQVMGARETLARHRAQVLLDFATVYTEFAAPPGDPRGSTGATSKSSPSNSSRPATASMSAK